MECRLAVFTCIPTCLCAYISLCVQDTQGRPPPRTRTHASMMALPESIVLIMCILAVCLSHPILCMYAHAYFPTYAPRTRRGQPSSQRRSFQAARRLACLPPALLVRVCSAIRREGTAALPDPATPPDVTLVGTSPAHLEPQQSDIHVASRTAPATTIADLFHKASTLCQSSPPPPRPLLRLL